MPVLLCSLESLTCMFFFRQYLTPEGMLKWNFCASPQRTSAHLLVSPTLFLGQAIRCRSHSQICLDYRYDAKVGLEDHCSCRSWLYGRALMYHMCQRKCGSLNQPRGWCHIGPPSSHQGPPQYCGKDEDSCQIWGSPGYTRGWRLCRTSSHQCGRFQAAGGHPSPFPSPERVHGCTHCSLWPSEVFWKQDSDKICDP